jgi:branched-chain amino acid transport system ATP-binding protein
MIEVHGLTVRFGGVVSLDEMTVDFPGGTCGLIGPNGAGKTTFFNVLSGFVTPAAGRVVVDGVELLTMRDYQRARWGVRRTFQTEQAIEALTVYENVATVHEHSVHARGTNRREVVMSALEFVHLAEVAELPVRSLRAKERRFIEVARAVVGEPKLVLLDEPAAGLPDEETAELQGIIREIPARTGATVVLVDHDMALVQACCDWTAVLDFGRLLACGPTLDVLHDERVMQAYLGIDESIQETP